MKIAVVGRGNIGGGLADLWEKADHDIVARCLVQATGAVGAVIGLKEANAVMGLPKPVAIAP